MILIFRALDSWFPLNYGYSMWFYFRLLFNIYPFLCSYDTSISVMLFWVVCAFLTMSTSLAILGQSVNVDVLEVLCRIGFKKVDSRDTGCVQSYFVYSPHTLILCSLLMSFRQRSWKVAIFFFLHLLVRMSLVPNTNYLSHLRHHSLMHLVQFLCFTSKWKQSMKLGDLIIFDGRSVIGCYVFFLL